MAKGIASGFQLSAVAMRSDVSDSCNPGMLGGTYEQNYFTLLYFTCILPALIQILAVTFAVTSGKVPNVPKSHDRRHQR